MGVKSAWMDSFIVSIGSCVHGHLDYFLQPSLGGRPNTKPLGDHGTLNAHGCWFILFYHVWGPAWQEVRWNIIWVRARWHMASHSLEALWLHCMILEVSWDNLRTLSFGLFQFHGHGSWLACEVALSVSRATWNYVLLCKLLTICFFFKFPRKDWIGWGILYNMNDFTW